VLKNESRPLGQVFLALYWQDSDIFTQYLCQKASYHLKKLILKSLRKDKQKGKFDFYDVLATIVDKSCQPGLRDYLKTPCGLRAASSSAPRIETRPPTPDCP
jgi:hypothetical protein